MDRDSDYIDADGYRANVGIVLMNDDRQVFIGGRVNARGWQFPQGGIRRGERPEQALYRELAEEVGLKPDQVSELARTRNWLRYRLPPQFVRRDSSPVCIGQKQRWYLLKLGAGDSALQLRLNRAAAGVRPLALGRLVGRGARRHLLQATGLFARAARARRSRLPGGPAAVSVLVARAHGRACTRTRGMSQKGRTITSSTMPIRSSDGTSLNQRYQRGLRALRPAANSRSSRQFQAW